MKKLIVTAQDSSKNVSSIVGGKGLNLMKLKEYGIEVPSFFILSSNFMEEYLKIYPIPNELENIETDSEISKKIESHFLSHPLPDFLKKELLTHYEKDFQNEWMAVRSSGLDEDSKDHSFAGQFSSFLNQKGIESLENSLLKCWASAYSERALSYRRVNGLNTKNLKMGVVIQKMVQSQSSGIVFSRDPMHPLDEDTIVVSAAYGLCEGIVSGELDADHIEISRNLEKIKVKIEPKLKKMIRGETGGIQTVLVSDEESQKCSVSDGEIKEISKIALKAEQFFGSPQDCEWAIENHKVYFVQARPITTLPSPFFYDANVNGSEYSLMDNSNIIESYSGVTSPLTFSFASFAYRQVYIQFCEFVGVPKALIESHESTFRNMLTLINGRIYYNLINWYKLVMMLPGSSTNAGFMETMMGVKQNLKPELGKLFDFVKNPPAYSFSHKMKLIFKTLFQFIKIDSTIQKFTKDFNIVYESHRKVNFETWSLQRQNEFYQFLQSDILKKWKAPIINDYLCMIFFGLLKKLTEKWIGNSGDVSSLQNDLLCGQGDLESTEPTKCLMRIADKIDNGEEAFKKYFLESPVDRLIADLSVMKLFEDFLDRYGFRCINELKLEEFDLHDDPSFAIQAVQSYVRTKSYQLSEMEKREAEIKHSAELKAFSKLSFFKGIIYKWVLKQARKSVRNRENLRFLRTKIFGVSRHLFRGMGVQLMRLGQIEKRDDIFYLTVEELMAFIEGRSLTANLAALVELRKKEFENYKSGITPPERFAVPGAVGVAAKMNSVLADGDLLKEEEDLHADPKILKGVSCCPGVIEGVVRVAFHSKEAEGLNGEILVTERTDPGWVPLYPACGGLLIERGSLLSHSAVVARELGLPTIVGVRGGLMKKLKTGMRVRVDAGKGLIQILD